MARIVLAPAFPVPAGLAAHPGRRRLGRAPSRATAARLLLPSSDSPSARGHLPTRRRFAPRLLAAAAPLLLAGACSRDTSDQHARAGDHAASSPAPGYAPPAVPEAPIEATPYAPGDLAQAGGVRGTVEVEGEIPPDTVVRPISDQEVCGDSIVDVTVAHDGNRLEGAVVWLVGVRGGKRLPLGRRYELSIEQCRMVPRTQAVLAGGTLNVHNSDKALHRTRFVRQGTSEPVATAPYSDDGQVVPVTTALARPGLVEARCDLHPWGRAWVAVFDQPYFAVSARDGAFALDSVPPGKYTLVAWHPRLGVVRDTVRIEAGRAAEVTLRLKGK